MIDRKAIKADARAALRGAKPHPALVTLAVAAILAILAALSNYLSGTFTLYRSLFETMSAGGDLSRAVYAGSDSGGGFASVLVFALEAMSGVLSVGYILYCMRVARRIPASVGDVFDVFGLFLRALLLRILKMAVLFVWEMAAALALSVVLAIGLTVAATTLSEDALMALLSSPWALVFAAVLYVPLLVASYFYRLSEYLLLDNPEMSCFQCLTVSRLAMRGRKWELFKLDLSFLGWYLLSLVPFVALWVQPYAAVAQVNFYQAVMPRFREEMAARAAQPPVPGPEYTRPRDREE